MAEIIRYRAIVKTDAEGGYQFRGDKLHATAGRAVQEAIDTLLADGIVTFEEVPVKKRMRTEYEEVE